MENLPKRGSAYVNQFLEEKAKPSLDSDLVGIQEKGDIINYEGILQNNFGIWIYYTSDDNDKIKKYILAINSKNEKFVNLPLIKDGIYLIQPKGNEEIIFELKNSKISLEEINLGENQKFLFQFIPEEMTYRILCTNGNSLFADANEGNTIKECEIFSEQEIKWKLIQNEDKIFFIEDNKSGKRMEFLENNEDKKIILADKDDNNDKQKFNLIFFEENKNDDINDRIKEDDNNIIENNEEKNKDENKIEEKIDNNEINFKENEEKENEKQEEIKKINMEINPEAKEILSEKEKDKNKILKFSAPKFIITEEDINEIKNKAEITHIEIDLSIEEIEDNIFKDFKNLISVYCSPKWLNKFDSKKLKEIFIKEGTIEIKREYFKFCFKLNLIYLPYSIINIEENSFENCLEINKIISEYKWYKNFEVETFIVPRGTSVLKKEIFFNWKHLKLIIVPLSVNKIEPSCFEKCFRLEEIEIPSGVKEIPKNCFKNCFNLKTIRLPESVKYIHPTAFIGCVNLENVYANEKIKKLFEKVLIIPDNVKEIKSNDYKDMPNIETLEIPLNKNIDPDFFKNFKNLRVINFDPNFIKFLDKTKINSVTIPEGIKEISPGTFKNMICLEYISIPTTMEKIEKNEFEDCVNVICVKAQSKFLEFFDKKILTSIILLEGEIDIEKGPFDDCENLESVIIPDCFQVFEDILFKNCHRLNNIKYTSGKNKEFKTLYEIPNDIIIVESDNYFFWTNVDTLIVNKNVEKIEPNFLMNCTDLQIVKIDPKFLPSLPRGEITCVIVPDFVKSVDEKNFKGCEKLKRVIFLGNTLLEGNQCDEFENITKLECNPFVLQYAKKNVRDKIKSVTLIDGCEILDSECLKDFKNLERIIFPLSLLFIGNKCFSGCEKLEQIFIPSTIQMIAEDAFENCPKLNHVITNSKFLNCLPKNQISYLDILNRNKSIENIDFSDFKNLKKIEFNENMENIPKNNFHNCPKLTDIICSKNFFQNLSKQDKQNFQNVELTDLVGEVPDDLFRGCPNLENINIPFEANLGKKKLEKKQEPTSVEEIMEHDRDNLKYKKYLIEILNSVQSDTNKINGPRNSLEEITHCIIDVVIKIKNFTRDKSGGKRVMIPHPVQCITIIRICDEILNGRGAIAQVKTGEGKSFIISVIAIVLVLHGRLVDVVTSNLELAIRDEKDQRDYYKLFDIKSGVLAEKNGDKDFLNLIKSQILINPGEEKKDSGYNLDVFEKPIVYSTNYNFEFAYLHSLFSDKPLRQRPYDVVIVDEVDNMFLDQSSSPAIIAHGIKILYHKDILEIIYLLKDNDLDSIMKVLKYYFPEGIDFDAEEIGRLQKSAKSAERHKINEDYIIENGKSVIIIDKTTGYKKPGSRWSNCIHEFVEIKEKVEIKNPQVSTCSITQCTFFNMYKSITGLSGTLGGNEDERILRNAYHINLFRVPRNLPSKVPVRKRPRPPEPDLLYEQLSQEIIELVENKRPVLVIFNTIRDVAEFLVFTEISLAKYNISTIQGVNPEEDRNAIKIAGEYGHITIATAAAGRGMDIKLDKVSLENGGLHVIIPYPMQNERVFWQCVGRCGRQGQPGSATQYISNDDFYYKTEDFDPNFENLLKLQNKFANFLKNEWSWLYKYPHRYGSDVSFTFNMSIDKMINVYIKTIPGYDANQKPELITSYYLDMILKAWGSFYTNVEQNLKKYSSYNQMEQDYYEKFMNVLMVWIPQKCRSVKEAQDSINAEILKRVDWLEVILGGLQVVGTVLSIVFPEVAPVIAIADIILSGGVRIYKKLSNNEPINWLQELLDAGVGLALNLSKLKVVKKGIGKIATKFLANKGGQKILELGNKFGNFQGRINNFLEKNIAGRIVKRVGEGIKDDIVDRKDEYLSALKDIGSDISKGEIPMDKIAKMAFEGAYNGCSNATNNFIKEKLEEKIPNKKLKKEFIKGIVKSITGFGNDVLFKNESIQKAAVHNVYKSLSDPFEKWKDEKFKGQIFKRHLIDGAQKTVADMIVDIAGGERALLKPNGEFNGLIIDELLKNFRKNEKDEIIEAIKEKLKKKKKEN